MLSKSQIKIITSLNQKKYRNKYELFVVEGKKSVLEFLNNKQLKFELDYLFYTEEFHELNTDKAFKIKPSDLKKISFLKTPNQVLAVFKIPNNTEKALNNGLIVALDDIKDPGNLGTIIRLCDWFGVNQLICSNETVDCFNPKVIQASMGSLTRISVVYKDLSSYLSLTKLPIYATLMNGENIYGEKLPKNAVIVMGNEANGISSINLELIKNKISIPKFGDIQQTESLNVATATAIILSEFRR